MSLSPQFVLLADRDLISEVGHGDAQAFATLYERHIRAAYALAYRLMGEKQASEDLLQEAFFKLWDGAPSYRAERGSVRTWILSIVRNRGIDQLSCEPPQDAGEDRVVCTEISAERGLCPKLAQLPARAGTRGPKDSAI
jgi:RNA polymerase sigma-70 factor, ECF subfamily